MTISEGKMGGDNPLGENMDVAELFKERKNHKKLAELDGWEKVTRGVDNLTEATDAQQHATVLQTAITKKRGMINPSIIREWLKWKQLHKVGEYLNQGLNREVFRKRGERETVIPVEIPVKSIEILKEMIGTEEELKKAVGYSPFKIFNIAGNEEDGAVEVACSLPGITLAEYEEMGIGISERLIERLKNDISKTMVKCISGNSNNNDISIRRNIARFLSNNQNYYLEWPEIDIVDGKELDFTKHPKLYINIANLKDN